MFNTVVIVARELSASSHAPYMTIDVPIRQREKSSTIEKSPRKPHLKIGNEAAASVFDGWGRVWWNGDHGVAVSISRGGGRPEGMAVDNKETDMRLQWKLLNPKWDERAPGGQGCGRERWTVAVRSSV